MSSSTLQAGVQRLRCLAAVQGRQDESDEQLLLAFTTRSDEAAFSVLVRRHGPMVFHVCRRVLGNQQDAEDAFQATFLVLARNAASLRNKTSLPSFLHGIAVRTAMKAKQTAARRGKRENRAPARPSVNPADELSWSEVRTLLDEEIARLPEKYRTAFVLCCLENLSQVEAARRLGRNERTLSSQLAAARKRLGQQLTRRGVALTAVLAAASLTAPASSLPVGLVTKTMKVILAASAGQGLASIISASVAELVQDTSAAMIASKAKTATIVLLAVSMLAGVSAWAYRGVAINALAPAALSAEPPPAKAEDKPRPSAVKSETTKSVEIEGRVLDPDDKPKTGAQLLLLEGGKVRRLGATADDGRFTIAIPKEAKGGHLIAHAEGYGIDFVDLPRGQPGKPLELRLVKDRVIRGRVVNTEGKPIAGVRVTVSNLGVYADNKMDSFLIAWKKRHFMSGWPGGVKHIWSGTGTLFAATTDAEGRFVLAGLGDERLVTLHLKGAGIADSELMVVTRDGFDPKPYNQATNDNIPKGMERIAVRWLLHGPNPSAVVEAEKLIRGIVKDADTGKGRPGVVVRLTRREGGALLNLSPEARTDAQGRYEIHGALKAQSYMLEAGEDVTEGYMNREVWAADTAGYDPITVDIVVKKGVIVTGKLIDQATGKPIRGFAFVAVLQGNPFVKDYPAFGNFHFRQTGADGTFRAVTLPGPVLLMGGPNDWATVVTYKKPVPDPKYPQYFTKDPNFTAYYGPGGGMSPLQGNYCKVLEIKADAKIVEQDIVLERASALPIRIEDADGKRLTDVWVGGSSPQDWYPPIHCKEAGCSAYQLEAGKSRLLVFFHPGRKLAGTLTLKGDEKEPVVAKLAPAASIKGRLLDAEGKPLAGVAIGVGYHQRVASEIHNIIHEAKQAITDETGTFALTHLIPDQKLTLSFHAGKRKFEHETKPADPAIQLKPAERRDLGAIKLKVVPEKPGE
jgi:RNA polymerase sigma factor (sigma-70 family)